MLMLADTENEKLKWVMALNELHRILKRNNLPNTMVSELRSHVACDVIHYLVTIIAVLLIDVERSLSEV